MAGGGGACVLLTRPARLCGSTRRASQVSVGISSGEGRTLLSPHHHTLSNHYRCGHKLTLPWHSLPQGNVGGFHLMLEALLTNLSLSLPHSVCLCSPTAEMYSCAAGQQSAGGSEQCSGSNSSSEWGGRDGVCVCLCKVV